MIINNMKRHHPLQDEVIVYTVITNRLVGIDYGNVQPPEVKMHMNRQNISSKLP